MTRPAVTTPWIAQPDYSEKWPVTSGQYGSLHLWKEGSR